MTETGLGMGSTKLTVTRIFKHNPDVWSFFMAPAGDSRPEFTAGQVAVLEMGEYGSFYAAFASSPDETEYEFLIKRSSTSQAVSSLFDHQFRKDAMLKQIVGHGFPVDKYRGHDLVFVGMGTGLAPLRSALRHVFHSRKDFGRLIVLYGVRTMDDFCYQDEMADQWRHYGVELRQVISQPGDAEWSGPTGYVQSLLDHLIPELNNPVALVCGSSEMIEQTTGRLKMLGFAPEMILTNY